jgi:hypothetical protein
MTSPALHREKAFTGPTEIPARWMSFIAVGTLTGGAVFSIAALFLSKNDLAIGLSVGALLSTFNFYGLKALTDKVLKQGEKGRQTFWFWNLLRWVLFAFICWLLVWVSPVCLLGAVVSYLWFLLVLGWAGLKWASNFKTS